MGIAGIYRTLKWIGNTLYFLLLGRPTANIVGATVYMVENTANVLLLCDETQDVLILKWEQVSASTNETRVFWGQWVIRDWSIRE